MANGTTKSYSIAEAKTHLAKLVHQAEDGPPIELTRRGRPVAVVMSIREYERLERPSMDSWDAVERLRRNQDLEGLDLDPNEIFPPQEDASPGKSFSW